MGHVSLKHTIYMLSCSTMLNSFCAKPDNLASIITPSHCLNLCGMAQIMRDYHEPKRGRYWLGKAPLVHRGFQTAWKEVKERVMEQMATIVETVHCPASLLRVYITGESKIWDTSFLLFCFSLELFRPSQ